MSVVCDWDFGWVSTEQFCHLSLWYWQNIKAEPDILWPFGNAELKPRKKLVPVLEITYFRREVKKGGGGLRVEQKTVLSSQVWKKESGISRIERKTVMLGHCSGI